MRASQIAATASVLFAGVIDTASAVTCYSGINIFTARGTGEVPATGLGIEGVHINAVLAAIPGSNATVVDYPASGDNFSVPVGVQNGTRQVEEYLDACPTSKIVIMGYSQGAVVQGYVLTGATLGVFPNGTAGNYTIPPLASKYASQIVAIVFWGDPYFNIDIGTNSDAPYPCNVSSSRPRTGSLWESYGSRLEEWCNYSDFACCGTGTTFAGHISYFSADNGTITANFVKGKYDSFVSGGNSSSTATGSAPVVASTGGVPKPSGSGVATGTSGVSTTTTTKGPSGTGTPTPTVSQAAAAGGFAREVGALWAAAMAVVLILGTAMLRL